MGAAGIGAAVSESTRFGGLGAKVDLTAVPTKMQLTPEEIFICETQARMLFQVAPQDVDEVLSAIHSQGAAAAVIGEITADKEAVFSYEGQVVARIPHEPPADLY